MMTAVVIDTDIEFDIDIVLKLRIRNILLSVLEEEDYFIDVHKIISKVKYLM